MSENPNPVAPAGRRTKRKWTVVVIGLAITVFGLREMWPVLSLVLGGTSGSAELVRVVKEKPGSGPGLVITDPVELERQIEAKDRTWTFWCDFRLTTDAGREVVVRMPVGGKHRPSVPFTEPDGSPYTLSVRYDAARPERVTFPTVLGVWFMPSIILYIGLVTVAAGIVLLQREPEAQPAGEPGDKPVASGH